MATIQIQNTQVSPLEALWSLYQSQTERVKKAFLKRIDAQNKADDNDAEMRAIYDSLTSEQRASLHQTACEINKRAQEVKQAALQGKSVGRDAEDFLAELREESEQGWK